MQLKIPDARISKIEWVRLSGKRDRIAGCNARLGVHGIEVAPPIARLTAGTEAQGFGWSRISPEQAHDCIGVSIKDIFDPIQGVVPEYYDIEYPVWDLIARANNVPVYAVVNPDKYRTSPFQVMCYDSSLYMNDLDIADHKQAADLIAEHAIEGINKGHRNFKIKVGRGAMHMDLAEGTARDIIIIRAVRKAAGSGARIMIDANDGYNYNLATQVLEETAEENIYWIEEPFREDRVLYEHLKKFLDRRELQTLIADGEGESSRNLLDWARDGLIDVIQYDIHSPGFSRWHRLGPELDRLEVGSAPHNWGDPFGNYAACHVAAGIRNFQMAEWDDALVPGLDFSRYVVEDGVIAVPNLPGFGIDLDERFYMNSVKERGFVVT